MRSIKEIFSFSKIFAVFLLLVFSSSFIFGASNFNLGNPSFNLSKVFQPGENLKGTINISFSEQTESSNFYVKEGSFLFGKFNLSQLLSANGNILIPGVTYTCEPSSCKDGYSQLGSAVESKKFVLGAGTNNIIGLKLMGSNVPLIESISMSLYSDAPESCTNQLAIDLFDDGVIDWANPTFNLESFCSSPDYGCYVPSTGTSTISQGKQYCGSFQINPSGGIYVGADLQGSGPATFNFIMGEEFGNQCEISVTNSSKVGCVINKATSEVENITLCLTQITGSPYKIYYEDNSPCGYVDYPENSHDFSLFTKGLRYVKLGNFRVNFSEIDDSYLLENYDYNCTKGCYIPIKFISGFNQEITINSINLSYESSGISVASSPAEIYNLALVKPKFTLPFTKLYLDNLGIKAPSAAGFHNISLYFGESKIGDSSIEVLSLPTIKYLYPRTVPAGYEINFNLVAEANSGNNTKYTWYFGDNSTKETSEPKVKHSYASLGTRDLLVQVSNNLGSVNKSFLINIESPQKYLNTTFSYYKTKNSELKNKISDFPVLVKNYLDKKFNISSNEERLVILQNQFNNAGNDSSNYIEIVFELSQINFPDVINFSQTSDGIFIPKKDNIDRNLMNSLTKSNYSGNLEAIQNAVYSWAVTLFSVSGNSKTYFASYDDSSMTLLTYFNFKFTPLDSINRAYFIISNPGAVLSWANTEDISSGKGFVLDGLESGMQKTLEFIIPGDKIGLLDAPIFYFPSSSELILVDEVVQCNYNSKCDKSSGENSENCKSDCKPWGRIFLWWGILLIVMLILYILAQEWYKRYYEAYLFKNKDDLYNLINFMDNAEKQGLGKEAMYSKLVGKEWDKEQLDFAYHKFKGQRTGMWEIPIFRFWENKKVFKEIEARKNIINPQLPPKPLVRFVGKTQNTKITTTRVTSIVDKSKTNMKPSK
ncbi:PKD domain-containing protein [Candidatus Pacearchaeota archaeon]|nr:PKD domain-containing protein [Candidatus Pacearchaeota archaeon]